MIAAGLAAFRPWAAPLALSLGVHGAIAAGAFGLFGLVEPPRPEVVFPVELVFAAPQPDAAVAAAPDGSPDQAADLPAGPIPTPEPMAPAAEAPAADPPPDRRAEAPAEPSPSPPLVAPVVELASESPSPEIEPPPLPRGKPEPPREPVPPAAAPPVARPPVADPVMTLADSAAAKAPPTAERAASPQQALLPGATALVPPGWGAPGLANPPPVYPIAARRRGVEGRVVLRVSVAADGAVEQVAVATSSGYALLDRAAQRAVERWRFVPGRIAGVPVAASVDVPILFRLKD